MQAKKHMVMDTSEIRVTIELSEVEARALRRLCMELEMEGLVVNTRPEISTRIIDSFNKIGFYRV